MTIPGAAFAPLLTRFPTVDIELNCSAFFLCEIDRIGVKLSNRGGFLILLLIFARSACFFRSPNLERV